MPGTVISAPEVTHVSRHGFWLLLDNEELLLSFEQFPWFRQATIDQISHVEWPTPDHLYWPELDIDLSLASVRQPEAFPLISKVPACSSPVSTVDPNNRQKLKSPPPDSRS